VPYNTDGSGCDSNARAEGHATGHWMPTRLRRGAGMKTQIIKSEVDMEVIEETALALAQATIQGAMDDAGMSRAELAQQLNRPKSFITRILTGTHNLTIVARRSVLIGKRGNKNRNKLPRRGK
jgi:ribosome-binding protein aMBF1 (putative translation factor)